MYSVLMNNIKMTLNPKDVIISIDRPKILLLKKHIDYLAKYGTDQDDYEYNMTEYLRMSGIYWSLTAMELMGASDRMPKDDIINFISTCQNKETGGISACFPHDPHILYTLSAIQVLTMYNRLDAIDVEGVVKFVASLQQPDGSFYGDIWGEQDTRFSFCAVMCLSLLHRLDAINVDKAVEFVLSCMNFDGGFGSKPGSESHAGLIYCCVGTLSICKRLDALKVDALAWWLCERQLPSGGLNGRPEKLPDLCYSWWVISSLKILNKMRWVDKERLEQFIMACQDPDTGGFSDRPGDITDPFHTLFGLAGLSLLGNIGSGTAGSVMAHRLATETNYTFIVIEAGTKSHALLEAPVLGPFFHGSLLDWQYQTVPQKHACYAMKNRRCKLAQGKILGGSSKLNNMIHVRGNLTHYQNWFHGKYTKEYIQKQFEFIENNVLHLNEVQYESELANTLLAAAKELGYAILDIDFKLGFRKNIVSQKYGKRWSTSDNLELKNIITNVLVEKIMFNGNTAHGVQVNSLGKKSTIYARKGVILSAGAINTPKILQLSGIGPENLLKSLGIPVIKNLPVGRNLQDHIGTGLDFVLFNKSVSISALDMINPFHVLEYFINGKGPWTTPGCEVIGFLSTKNQSEPDLQFMVLPVGLSSDRGSLLRNNVNIKDEIWDKYFSKSFDSYVGTILPLILHPKSRGYVFINSTDPSTPPLLDPKYLSHKDDRDTLINGLKLVMKFVNTEAIRNVGGYINQNHFPGCDNFEIFTDLYFDCYIKHLSLTSYHPVGTCSMGLLSSKNTVVDTSFKIVGMKNLYVADASVLPTLPSGNINAAISMMASICFETIIKPDTNIPFCYKNDRIDEFLFKVCFYI
ncbi:hypothetical protein HF086_007851 [Spodoptera exigua]|uniref:protein geranylgeranyltransferase type II n=1 Tax=Spodoptera exigua TaxID=7107 RepID=A0A922M1M6_SPOEX|nr:hypothetical protein HF086_007851 [Spodoptera exigua]